MHEWDKGPCLHRVYILVKGDRQSMNKNNQENMICQMVISVQKTKQGRSTGHAWGSGYGPVTSNMLLQGVSGVSLRRCL